MKVNRHHLHLAIGVLVIAIAWSAWSYMRGSGRPPMLVTGTGGHRPLLESTQTDLPTPVGRVIDPASIPAPLSVEGAAASASDRDPFLFGGESREVKAVAVPVGADPRVRSILFSSGRRLALVENRIVAAGDTVGDFTVVQIDRDAVIFTTVTGERRRVPINRPIPSGIRR